MWPGNAGVVLYGDILVPLPQLVLFLAYLCLQPKLGVRADAAATPVAGDATLMFGNTGYRGGHSGRRAATPV
jgi:hypothetical protein